MKNKYILYLLCFVFIALQAQAQQITISGKVTDAKNSEEPLVGATIVDKSTKTGTIADIDGNYTLKVDPNTTLIVSFIGYQSQEIEVAGRTTIDIPLLADDELLEEFVVIGYGIQKKSVVTGAIAKVESKDLENMPVTRIEQSLQGRTSGVRVTTDSGQPGAGAVVRIRGTTTFNNSNPLYVVDGIPIEGGIDYLNQNDIESIEVLKDAASASIYGTRAANGVILVTTKSGKKGKIEVDYHGYYGWQHPWKKLAVLNATEYGILMNESAAAAGMSPIYDNPNELGEGTDWQDAIFNESAPIQNHNVSIAAGSEKSTYYASFGYFDHVGIIASDRSQYRRHTVRFNGKHDLTERVTFGHQVAFSHVKSVSVSTNSEFGSPLMRAVNIDPITPILETDPDVLASNVFQNQPVVTNEDGIPYAITDAVTSEVLNPVAALAVANGHGASDKVVSSFYTELEPIDGLKLRSSIGADLAFWEDEGFTPVHYLNPTNSAEVNSYNRSKNRGLFWIWTNTISYDKTIRKHNITGLLGTSAEKNTGEGQGGRLSGIPVDNIEDASLSLGNQLPIDQRDYWGYEYQDRLTSIFGRVVYNYDEKYLFTGVLRRDGSSKFGSNNKFGVFPSVSLGWVVSQENFFPQNNVVNFLKIRGSWGVNGNNKIQDFAYESLVGGARNYIFGTDDELTNGISPNAIANPDLHWEETTQFNIGFDAKLFKRIDFTTEFFIKNTEEILFGIEVPGYVGNQGPLGNIGNMDNTGVEMELAYENEFGAVNVDVSGNLTYVKNELTFLGEDKDFFPGATFGPQGLEISRATVGFPIGYFFGHLTDGIFQNEAEVAEYVSSEGVPIQPDAVPGDFRFQDINNDGVINDDDRTIIGDPTPEWTYGLSFSADWKGLDINLFGQGVWGNEVYKATRRYDLPRANLTAEALGRWTGEGSTDEYPRLTFDDTNANFSRSSDFYVENGAFFRIKTLQIGYTLPAELTEKFNIKQLRFYVSGNNLWTITGYSGFDPEIGGGSFGIDRGLYPQARFYLVGANVKF